MAGPGASTAIYRYDLSLPFTEFDLAMNRQKYVGHKIFKPRPTAIQAANIGRLKLEQLLFQIDTRRSPGGSYKGSDFELGVWQYQTEEFGFEETIDDRQLAIYRDLMDAESIHAARAENVLLDHFERDCAAALYNTSVFTGALTYPVTYGWNGPINATPIQDIIFGAKQQFRAQFGGDPNAMVLNSYQLDCLINTDQLVERVKFTQIADQKNMFAALQDLLGVEEILVAGGYTNSAIAPTSRNLSRIWGDSYAALLRVAKTEDPQEPCVGRTFFFTGDGQSEAEMPEGGDGFAVIMEEYREESRRGSVMRARNDRQVNLMYVQACQLLTAVIQEGAT